MANAEVFVQNDQMYIGDDESLHIVGEILNELSVPINQVDVYATLYTDDGNIVDTISASTLVNRVMPGMKGPFDLLLIGNQARFVDNYILEFDYKISEPKSQVIGISSSEFSRDSFDNLMITGTVTNNGEITANTVTVIVTLYDREGKVAAVSKVQTEPDYLRSNEEMFFLVSVPDKLQSTTAVDYSLVAESEEYSAVPEFPLGSMFLLVSSVSVYLILTRYSGRIITNLVSASNLK